MDWQLLPTAEYINLEQTLFSGQIFTFTRCNDPECFTGCLDAHTFTFWQKGLAVLFKTTHPCGLEYLTHFFTLDVCYKDLISGWRHPWIVDSGLRLLRVDLYEVVFSFICSQNNNIKRISKMVTHLKAISKGFTCLNFNEKDLRANKFGYRARYVLDAAEVLKGIDKETLVKSDRRCIEALLMSIKGVGRKVCDCILLMGFSFFDVVPLDVHMARVTKMLFKDRNVCVSTMYRDRFGEYCGIAQLYLFKYSVDNKGKLGKCIAM